MTRIDPTIAIMCLQILDGDESVMPMLSDRLEEMRSQQAESIRTRDGAYQINGCKIQYNLMKPLDLVLYALPDEICWRLVCDYAEHVLPECKQGLDRECVRLYIEGARAWIAERITDADLDAFRASTWETANRLSQRQGETGDIWIVMSSAVRAARAATRVDRGDPRLAVRAAAREAQEARGLNPEAEREWQLERLRQYLRGDAS